MRQRVLITAGADGIGLEIAKCFLKKNALVWVADLNQNAIDNLPKSINARCVDVCDEIGMKVLFDEISKTWGGLDVLCANAGIAGPTAGRNQMPYVAASVLAGGNVRVGLEDNLMLEKGVLATNESATSEGHGFQAHVGPMRSPSRGEITLKSGDPYQPPRIKFNYMSTLFSTHDCDSLKLSFFNLLP